jgi:hypothetical protein
MNAKTLWTGLIVVATALLIVLGLLTRPHQPPQTGKTPQTPKITSNPLEVPLVEHMIEDGLDVARNPDTNWLSGASETKFPDPFQRTARIPGPWFS